MRPLMFLALTALTGALFGYSHHNAIADKFFLGIRLLGTGWVLILPSPTFLSPWKRDRIPVATPGASSPSLSNEAARMRSSPVGRSSVASIFCSIMPTKLLT